MYNSFSVPSPWVHSRREGRYQANSPEASRVGTTSRSSESFYGEWSYIEFLTNRIRVVPVNTVADSLSPVRHFRSSWASVKGFFPASLSEIASFWESVDSTLNDPFGKYRIATLAKKSFFYHCCRVRHYTFSVLKCGSSPCSICRPARLPSDVFNKLHHLPDPTLGENSLSRSCLGRNNRRRSTIEEKGKRCTKGSICATC